MDPKDDTYGPWLVVSRKKPNKWKEKRYSPALTTLMHASWHEGLNVPVVSEGAAKLTPGSGSSKITEGKRKASGELAVFGEPTEEFSALKGKGVSLDSPNETRLFKEGTTKAYEGPPSIKGKKVLARLRVALANFRSADTREGNRSSKIPKTTWSPTNDHTLPSGNGKFQFLSKSRNEMGNMLVGKDCGNITSGD